MSEKLIRNEQEAIEAIRANMPTSGYYMLRESLDMAIKALEKQIPKKPKLVTRTGGIIKFYPCPCCSTAEKYISVYPKQKHCCECGQALDWGLMDEER